MVLEYVLDKNLKISFRIYKIYMTQNIQAIHAIASNIQLLVSDVDGVLTDGKLWFSATGEEMKAFHIHDGLGIKRLLQHGIEVAIISGRKSAALSRRMQELGVKFVYQGIDDKLTVLANLIGMLHLHYENVAYIGDDLPDLPCMQKVGLSVTVRNAVVAVRQCAALITEAKGGRGAVREVCDLILSARGI